MAMLQLGGGGEVIPTMPEFVPLQRGTIIFAEVAVTRQRKKKKKRSTLQ